MTNSNSNYQLGQATHREYEAQYGRPTPQKDKTQGTMPNLLKLITIVGSIVAVGSIFGQLIA